ncbi:MAG: hypothetical protein ACLRZH_06375 [Ruthenibacterium lactatiformans]
MKNRICAALLTLVLCLPLAGCAGGASSGISASYPAEPLFWCGFRYAGRKGLYRGHPPADGTHLSDEIREAVEAGLARGAAAGYTVEVVYKNAQEIPRPSAPSRSSSPHRALM